MNHTNTFMVNLLIKDNNIYNKLTKILKQDAMTNCNWGEIDGRPVLLDYARKSQYMAVKDLEKKNKNSSKNKEV